jgi:hypothetical protein
MGQRIAAGFRGVLARRYDFRTAHKDCSDGDLVGIECGLCLLQSQAHEVFIEG